MGKSYSTGCDLENPCRRSVWWAWSECTRRFSRSTEHRAGWVGYFRSEWFCRYPLMALDTSYLYLFISTWKDAVLPMTAFPSRRLCSVRAMAWRARPSADWRSGRSASGVRKDVSSQASQANGTTASLSLCSIYRVGWWSPLFILDMDANAIDLSCTRHQVGLGLPYLSGSSLRRIRIQHPQITTNHTRLSNSIRSDLYNFTPIHLMEEILHHLGCIKPCKWWDIYHINWLAGFLVSHHLSGGRSRGDFEPRIPCRRWGLGGGLPEDTQRLMGNICCLLGTVFPFSFNLVLVELRRWVWS